MSTRIKIELSEKSINDAIKQLKDYKKSLSAKNSKFVERLADEGIAVVNATLVGVNLNGDDWSYNAKKSNVSSGETSKLRIELSGKRLLFVEFGAGVTYSNPQHPKADELGYGVGTYNPYSRNAWNPDGWDYVGEDGTPKHTFGNPAYAPAWNASVQMRNKVISIAKEVFGK